MNIFLIDLDKFDKNLLFEFEKTCKTAATKKNELKKLQHLAGRYIVNYAAKKFYNLSDSSLTYEGEKPVFKNSDLHFSISHCKNLVAVGFSENNLGIDIEYNKADRNFIQLINRFDKDLAEKIKSLEKSEQRKFFYEFWTKYEAAIKLGTSVDINYQTLTVNDDFTLSAATTKKNFCKIILTFLDGETCI